MTYMILTTLKAVGIFVACYPVAMAVFLIGYKLMAAKKESAALAAVPETV